MVNNREFSVFSQSSKPHVKFFRLSGNGKNAKLMPVIDLGFGQYNEHLNSYSFSRNVNSLYGEFEIQAKEDYARSINILDSVKPLDIVYFYENGKDVAFIGIVQTVSFGATAGAFNKSVIISGASIGILFEMLKISTDATSMAFFIKDSANKNVLDTLADVLQTNVKNGGQGMSFEQAFSAVYKEFISVLVDEKNSRIAANGIYDIIKACFGEPSEFIKVFGKLNFNYQISKTLFSSDEVNIYSYFKDLLPEQAYEFYEDVYDGKPVLIAREKPFDTADWNKLKENIVKLNPALVTDYTVSKSDKDVHTCFFAMAEGTNLSNDFYKIISATEQGSSCFESNLDKIKMYGYRPLIVNFIGYANAASDGKNEASYLIQTFQNLSKRLKEWYSRIDEMYSGDVTMVADHSSKAVKIGGLVELCRTTFYVTGEKHSWSYGDSPTVNYTLERGGNYTEKGFNPVKDISGAFAELLERD